MKNGYVEYKLHSNNKQSKDELLIEWAVRTTTQILWDLGQLYKYDNADNL